MPAQPRRTDIAAAYDRGVEAYDALWSPVILPPAEAVVAALGLGGRDRVLDVGGGTGALLPAIRAAAPAARPVVLDVSLGMLRAASRRAGAVAVQADAAALPVAGASVDAVLLAFVLFHLSDPAAGLVEAARALRQGGRVGTVTWAREVSAEAYAVWDEGLAEAGVPPPPSRRVDAGLDRPEAVEGLLAAAGLRPERTWTSPLRRRWVPATYWELLAGSGMNRARLEHLEASAREAVLARLRHRLGQLAPTAFDWEGEVVCAVATKEGPAA